MALHRLPPGARPQIPGGERDGNVNKQPAKELRVLADELVNESKYRVHIASYAMTACAIGSVPLPLLNALRRRSYSPSDGSSTLALRE
jgi:hypothetical protein